MLPVIGLFWLRERETRLPIERPGFARRRRSYRTLNSPTDWAYDHVPHFGGGCSGRVIYSTVPLHDEFPGVRTRR
jgi:hypothetical protein